jgi:hypothetical protein
VLDVPEVLQAPKAPEAIDYAQALRELVRAEPEPSVATDAAAYRLTQLDLQRHYDAIVANTFCGKLLNAIPQRLHGAFGHYVVNTDVKETGSNAHGVFGHFVFDFGKVRRLLQTVAEAVGTAAGTALPTDVGTVAEACRVLMTSAAPQLEQHCPYVDPPLDVVLGDIQQVDYEYVGIWTWSESAPAVAVQTAGASRPTTRRRYLYGGYVTTMADGDVYVSTWAMDRETGCFYLFEPFGVSSCHRRSHRQAPRALTSTLVRYADITLHGHPISDVPMSAWHVIDRCSSCYAMAGAVWMLELFMRNPTLVYGTNVTLLVDKSDYLRGRRSTAVHGNALGPTVPTNLLMLYSHLLSVYYLPHRTTALTTRELELQHPDSRLGIWFQRMTDDASDAGDVSDSSNTDLRLDLGVGDVNDVDDVNDVADDPRPTYKRVKGSLSGHTTQDDEDTWSLTL